MRQLESIVKALCQAYGVPLPPSMMMNMMGGNGGQQEQEQHQYGGQASSESSAETCMEYGEGMTTQVGSGIVDMGGSRDDGVAMDLGGCGNGNTGSGQVLFGGIGPDVGCVPPLAWS